MSEADDGQLRDGLRAALAGEDDYLADVLGRPGTTLEEREAPYLRTYRVFRVRFATSHAAQAQDVGYAPGAPAYVLAVPDDLVDLAQADGAAIDSPAAAAAYATAYVELDRSPRELLRVVGSMADVELLPDPGAAERRAQERFRERFADVLHPPAAEPAANAGHVVELYALRQQALERHVLDVGRDGAVLQYVDVLDEHAPVVYGA